MGFVRAPRTADTRSCDIAIDCQLGTVLLDPGYPWTWPAVVNKAIAVADLDGISNKSPVPIYRNLVAHEPSSQRTFCCGFPLSLWGLGSRTAAQGFLDGKCGACETHTRVGLLTRGSWMLNEKEHWRRPCSRRKSSAFAIKYIFGTAKWIPWFS